MDEAEDNIAAETDDRRDAEEINSRTELTEGEVHEVADTLIMFVETWADVLAKTGTYKNGEPVATDPELSRQLFTQLRELSKDKLVMIAGTTIGRLARRNAGAGR